MRTKIILRQHGFKKLDGAIVKKFKKINISTIKSFKEALKAL